MVQMILLSDQQSPHYLMVHILEAFYNQLVGGQTLIYILPL